MHLRIKNSNLVNKFINCKQATRDCLKSIFIKSKNKYLHHYLVSTRISQSFQSSNGDRPSKEKIFRPIIILPGSSK